VVDGDLIPVALGEILCLDHVISLALAGWVHAPFAGSCTLNRTTRTSP